MQQHTPMISLDAVLFASPHPETLAEFYQLAFELGPPRWHGDNHLGLNLSNTYLGFDRTQENTPPGASVSIWFRVTDIQATFERLVRLGAKVIYAPTEEESPGEILAMVSDIEGNSVGLISSL
jgi:predicted enzyme related to lactoylglutathione lyase